MLVSRPGVKRVVILSYGHTTKQASHIANYTTTPLLINSKPQTPRSKRENPLSTLCDVRRRGKISSFKLSFQQSCSAFNQDFLYRFHLKFLLRGHDTKLHHPFNLNNCCYGIFLLLQRKWNFSVVHHPVFQQMENT